MHIATEIIQTLCECKTFFPFHVTVSLGPPGPPGSTARRAVERYGGRTRRVNQLNTFYSSFSQNMVCGGAHSQFGPLPPPPIPIGSDGPACTVTNLANFCVTPLFRRPQGGLPWMSREAKSSTEFEFGGLVR